MSQNEQITELMRLVDEVILSAATTEQRNNHTERHRAALEAHARSVIAADRALCQPAAAPTEAQADHVVGPYVKPLFCPKCRALWLFWPKEISGMETDSLNLRSDRSCDFCEPATADQLESPAPAQAAQVEQRKGEAVRADMPVIGYLRATSDGEPIWSEDCVCADAIYPTCDDYGAMEEAVSMAVVRQSDALAALVAKHGEVEALRKDAERYRWLRDDDNECVYVLLDDIGAIKSGDALDSAIDDALASAPPKE